MINDFMILWFFVFERF